MAAYAYSLTPLLAVRLEVAAGLAALLGLVWLLRGARAAVRACAMVGVADLVAGLAAGSAWLACGGAAILGCSAWAWYRHRGVGA